MSQHSTIIARNWSMTSTHTSSKTKDSIISPTKSCSKSSLMWVWRQVILRLVKLLLWWVILQLLLIILWQRILWVRLVMLWLQLIILWVKIFHWSLLLSLHKICIHRPFLEKIVISTILFILNN